MASLKDRVKRIQKLLGVKADGIIGPVTLTKIEEKLDINQDDYSLQVSRKGIKALPADAQAMLLSLIYNRGAALSGSRRREMKAIRALVKKGDLKGISEQFYLQ